jgi:hypothetical protein
MFPICPVPAFLPTGTASISSRALASELSFCGEGGLTFFFNFVLQQLRALQHERNVLGKMYRLLLGIDILRTLVSESVLPLLELGVGGEEEICLRKRRVSQLRNLLREENCTSSGTYLNVYDVANRPNARRALNSQEFIYRHVARAVDEAIRHVGGVRRQADSGKVEVCGDLLAAREREFCAAVGPLS